MGKQNNSDDAVGKGILLLIIILIIIWLIFSLATLLAPVAVLVLFLVNWIRYLARDRKWRAINFWLTRHEQELYGNVVYRLAQAEEERKNVRETVTAKGIARNQDGQISQRSYAGKDLRERENTANSLVSQYTPVYRELQSRPYRRWKKARSHYSNTFGFGFILLLLGIGMLIPRISNVGMLPGEGPAVSTAVPGSADSAKVAVEAGASGETEKVAQAKETGEATGESSEDSDFLGDLLSFLGTSIGIMAGFFGVLAIIWFIGWLIGRIRFGLKNPKPPFVSTNNVDTHIEKYREKRARKEAERSRRKKESKEKRERERMAREEARAEKKRAAEKKAREDEMQKQAEGTRQEVAVAVPETSAPAPAEEDTRQRSREEQLFISWAESLRNEGYNITGNWDNWENSGPWKNLAVVASVNGVGVRVVVEYYVKSRKIYFGIARLNEEENVSRELLNSETLQKIIRENGLTVKNNETWYCLKFSTFDKVFQEYRQLIEAVH